MKRQRGVALIVALIILVPLTLIAVVVMQSSGQDLKMAGSAASFRQAEHRLEGIIEAAMQSNNVSTLISNMGASAAITVNSSNASAAVALTTRTETVCKRKVEASSNNVIPACKYVELQTSVNYGKYASQLNWVAGVEQPLLTK
ncbi:type IVa pilus pseudopilin TppD [Aeromonas sp. NJAU223]|uniref:type IVa pilus pseudopilin TppD n=1 Tax=Aeromonas sp. NJAU223 TaxID=3115650 RepID=UPI003DA88D36